MKKIIMLTLVLTTLMLSCAVTAFADTEILWSGKCGDNNNITWTINKEGTLTISGTGTMYGYYWQPSDVPWNMYKTSIRTVVINKGVTDIGAYAFYSCRNLTDVKIAEGIKDIGSWAFRSCSGLESITIPEGVTSLSGTFYDCRKLKNVTIPNSVTAIGSAFTDCISMTDITIPKGVTEVGAYTFDGCSSLENINVAEDNPKYCSVDGVLFDKDKTRLVRYPSGKTGVSYDIPDGVTSISEFAFGDCCLKNITLPKSVEQLDMYAFAECPLLEGLIIPYGITRFTGGAFRECYNLSYIIVPESVTEMGNYVFLNSNKLAAVYYSGSKEQWNNIEGLENASIPDTATIVFNYKAPEINIEKTETTQSSIKFTAKVNGLMYIDVSSFGTTFIPLPLINIEGAKPAVVKYDNTVYNISDGQTYGATIEEIPETFININILGKSFIVDGDGNYVWSPAKYTSVAEGELKSH